MAMMELLKRLWLWILVGPPTEPARPRRARRKKFDPALQNLGEFYFRKDILDQIEQYFKIIRRMKKHDRDAYHLYSKTGGIIVPEVTFPSGLNRRVDSYVNEVRPSFGCVFFSLHQAAKDPYRNLQSPRCMYFQKYAPGKAPPDLQPFVEAGADIYCMTVYWEWERQGDGKGINSNWAAPAMLGMAVLPDGRVHALKLRQKVTTSVRSKKNTPGQGKKNGRPGGHFSLSRTDWVYPKFWEGVGPVDKADHLEFDSKSKMEILFCIGVQLYEAGLLSMAKVVVKKGNIRAIFGVHVERTPYFFRDRDVTITEGGQKRKIFHVVRTHRRRLTGRTVNVKMHCRGERRFTWNGYRIEVSIPGLHHRDMSDFNVGAVDLAPKRLRSGLLDAKEMAKKYLEWEKW